MQPKPIKVLSATWGVLEEEPNRSVESAVPRIAVWFLFLLRRGRTFCTHRNPIEKQHAHSVADVTAAVQALLPNPPTSLSIPSVGAAALGGVADPAPGKRKELKVRVCRSMERHGWLICLPGCAAGVEIDRRGRADI